MRKLLLILVALLSAAVAIAQTRVAVTGKVTDKTGAEIPGVTVLVKGTGQGAATDVNGVFTLSCAPDSRLVFSFLGYVAQEVALEGRTTVNVTLASDSKQLEDVVVVGYGTQTKTEFTGAAARVSGEAVKDLPVQSFDQGLAGKATGVSIGQPNGVLNNAPVIRIRGVNSISLSSYPLIVVDGIPINTGNLANNGTVANNPLGDINPADIASIDVLKDAASTAIYGSRAAAGVILITTKSGKNGKPRVTYEGWAGATRAVRLPKMLNAEQFMLIKNEAVLNAKISSGNEGNSGVAGASFFPTYNPDGSLVDTNWYDYVYQTGVSQNHSLSVSGGSETTKYYLSTNYSDQKGILKTNEFTRKGVRFNLSHQLTPWINLAATANYNNTLNASPNTGSLEGNAFGLVGAARLAWLSAPNVYAVNPDGSYNLSGANTLG
ncbi:MAG: SusC/RagA family TonB-linked outer membrane protein, partial [Hymenobacter sp.]